MRGLETYPPQVRGDLYFSVINMLVILHLLCFSAIFCSSLLDSVPQKVEFFINYSSWGLMPVGFDQWVTPSVDWRMEKEKRLGYVSPPLFLLLALSLEGSSCKAALLHCASFHWALLTWFPPLISSGLAVLTRGYLHVSCFLSSNPNPNFYK